MERPPEYPNKPVNNKQSQVPGYPAKINAQTNKNETQNL